MNIRACNTAMQNVTDNCYSQVSEIFFVMTDGVHIQQTLRGMCMASITRIDHVHMVLACIIEMLGNQEWRTRGCVTHNEHIRMHRRQVIDGIEQEFPLTGTGGRDIEVNDVCR